MRGRQPAPPDPLPQPHFPNPPHTELPTSFGVGNFCNWRHGLLANWAFVDS